MIDHVSIGVADVARPTGGGRDSGAPGVRSGYAADVFAAFVVGPDGYRIDAYCGGV